MMRPTSHTLLCTLIVLSCGTTAVLAHPDDPKVRDRIPPYAGPGYYGGPAAGGEIPLAFEASGLVLRSWITVLDFGPQMVSGNDCWGYVSESGREYAIMGLSHGTAFVEITDPDNPVIIDIIDGPASLWHDVKVYQQYAYAVSEGGEGIQVMDLGQIDDGIVTSLGNIVGIGTNSTHNVAIDETSGFLYRCGGGDNGLRIYSLANPTSPAYVASWPDRYVHDAEVVTFTTGPNAGKQIAFCCSGFDGGWVDPGLTIVDVTQKDNLQTLGQIDWQFASYSHQVWMSPDGQYVYVNDELDEGTFGLNTTTIVIDISDLENPFVASTFTNNSTAVGHNLYIKDNLLFEANYRSGLRVFDLAGDPLNPLEIAYFDTWPGDDNPNFNGLWSTYPFLPSGTIIGSDIEKGLFVWTLGDPELAFLIPGGIPDLVNPAGDSIVFEVVEQNGGVLVDGSVRFIYDVGNGFADGEVIDLGDNLFAGVVPPGPCADQVSYYFEATSESGITTRAPNTAPNEALSAVLGVAEELTLFDDLEATNGWFVGDVDDDASTGIWELGNPNGSSAQPENDHTEDGTLCFFTGQAPPDTNPGTNDVDDGKTTLFSPAYDLTGTQEVRMGYWRWYDNAQGASPNADVFVVDISDDGGASWVNVETVGPSGDETAGGWFFHEFRVLDFIELSGNVMLRFIASDEGDGSLVEAAIDDLQITDFICVADLGDFNADGAVTLADFAGFVDCMAGPGAAVSPTPPTSAQQCLTAFDFDTDDDVDSLDLSAFITVLTNP